jgi:glycosyltransferase involved in cell wall biosynthesis
MKEMNNKQVTSFSICIPVYNCNVTALVSELHRQAVLTNCPFEILLIDDNSTSFLEENRKLQSLPNLLYTELAENVGRAKIRNLLAQAANYPYLIYMDCDTCADNPAYVRRYLDALPAEVVVGGYGYSPTPPEKKYSLRWSYGICREERPASLRNRKPNKSFSTFNFMIRKEIVEKIRFNEQIFGYGHEDTLFGWELKKQGVVVKHIDNPLIHKELDDNKIFVEKTENSVRNLWKIYQDITEKEEFIQDNQLLKCYILLRKYRLSGCYSFFFNLFRPLLYKNLCSKHPRIRFFDLYKLGILNQCRLGKD